MKSPRKVRKVDELGRVALPVKIRKTFDIKKNDAVEIFIEGDNLVLRKFTPGCICCGETHDIRVVNGKHVCQKCLDTIKTSS